MTAYSPWKPKDQYERIVSRVVEGQIRSFLIGHPELAEAWIGKRAKGKTKEDAVVDSMAKRITRDLICPDTRRRITLALEAVTEAEGPENVEPSAAPDPIDSPL